MKKCPRCGNEDLSGGKETGPPDEHGVRRVVYEFYCGHCGLQESSDREDPGFGAFYRRWSGPNAPDGGERGP